MHIETDVQQIFLEILNESRDQLLSRFSSTEQGWFSAGWYLAQEQMASYIDPGNRDIDSLRPLMAYLIDRAILTIEGPLPADALPQARVRRSGYQLFWVAAQFSLTSAFRIANTRSNPL